MLLEKRDSTSYDLIQIHSEKIYSRLKKIQSFSNANSIGCYYSIGSEVQTKPIILDLLNQKKHVSLPKTVNDIIILERLRTSINLKKVILVFQNQKMIGLKRNHLMLFQFLQLDLQKKELDQDMGMDTMINFLQTNLSPKQH